MFDVEKIKAHGIKSDEYREFLAGMANILISDVEALSKYTPEEIIANRRFLFEVVKEIHNTKGDIYAEGTAKNPDKQTAN